MIDLSSKAGTNWIAVLFMTQATLLAFLIFIIVRFDGRMQLLALGAAIGQITQLSAVAGVLLTGKALQDHASASELPPGSLMRNEQTVQTPPISRAEAIMPVGQVSATASAPTGPAIPAAPSDPATPPSTIT